MKHRLIPISLAVALILLVATWLTFHQRSITIRPHGPWGEKLSSYHYSDYSDGGSSFATHQILGSRLIFVYRLESGFEYPYAGLGWDLFRKESDNNIQYLDLQNYDSLVIQFRSTSSEDVRIQIITHDPEISRPHAPLTNRFLIASTTIQRGWTTQALALSDFSIPEWWFKQNNLKPDPGSKFLNKAYGLSIQSGTQIPLGIQDTIEIGEVRFVGENRSLGYILIGIALILLGGFAFLTWMERERLRVEKENQLAARREQALESAEKIPLSSHRTEDARRILDYIGKHYTESAIDLETVCRETMVNRNRLSTILKEQVGTTFKGHLTDLRLSEATRALAETDLQVTEIAFKVGFGNVSHFNRVFKERFQITPVEFRKQKNKEKESS